MITREDLQQAITECLTAPNPNANTCIKLAAFYILSEHISDGTSGKGTSEFMEVVKGKPIETVMQILDETMSVLQAANPMLYDRTIKKLMM